VQKALVARNASLLLSERIADLSLWVEGKQGRRRRSDISSLSWALPPSIFARTCAWAPAV